MSNTAQKLINIGTIAAYCKYLQKGVARNRLNGEAYKLIDNHKSKYAFIVPSFKKNEILISGSMTWGDSGFSFQANLNSKANDVIIKLHPHKHCSIASNDLEKIVIQLLDDMKVKIINEIPPGKERPKYPMLLACKKPRKRSKKSIDNVHRYINEGIFNEEFGTAVNSHHKDGIRCHRKKEKTSSGNRR